MSVTGGRSISLSSLAIVTQSSSIYCQKSLNLSKSWEMVLTGKTTKQVPNPLPSIGRKPELKLLGVTFNRDPCNWVTQIDLLFHNKAIVT